MVYKIKIKVFTYTSYEKHFEIYIKIDRLIVVKSCRIGLPRKDIILLSDIALILFKAVSRTVVQDIQIKCTLSAGTLLMILM